MSRKFALTRLLALITLFGAVGCASLIKQPTIGGAGYSGHGASAVDPKVVAEFKPTSLPTDVARFVQNMVEISNPGAGVLSPDGKTLFFTWSASGVNQVWKVDGPMRFPVQMTSGSDPTNVISVTPDGKFLIVSRDFAGEENPGIYMLPTDGGPLTEIQHKKGSCTYLGWISNGSDKIYYFSNDIKADSYAIYSFDVANKKKELLFSEPGLWTIRDVWAEEVFLLARMTGATTREYFTWSLRDKKLVPVIGQNEKEEYDVKFGFRQNEFLVLTAKFGEFHRLYLLKDSKLDPITPDVKMEIDQFAIDYKRHRLYINWNDNGFSKLEARDPETMKKVAMPEIRGADGVYLVGTSRFGRYAMLSSESSVYPRVSYVFDWKENRLTQWTKPSVPEVDTSKFVRSTLEFYPAADGSKIPMLVTRPSKCAADPCPVVVHFHGGPEGQSVPMFNRLAQIFAASGFVFVEPNVRGSEGYGKAYRQADDGPKRLNVITDIEDCSKYIRQNWAKNGISPKVGVIGWSYGGYATLMAMTRFAGAYDAGVALVGMSNLRTFLLNTAPYRRILRISEYGDPEKDKDALEKLSPMNYIDRVRDPLMIIQGVSDPRVPVGEAVQFHGALKARGVSAPLILFAEQGHGTVRRDDRVLEYGHSLLFFKQHLLR